MSEKVNSQVTLRAEFWRSPDDALLTRACVAAGLCHSVRWLIAQETGGNAPRRMRVGGLTLYRKRDALAHWVAPAREVDHV